LAALAARFVAVIPGDRGGSVCQFSHVSSDGDLRAG
jgi:hypothetical protein